MSKKKYIQFEWYVLNEINRNDPEKRCIGEFNIFDNIILNKFTNDLCVRYKRKNMTFDEFVDNLTTYLMWEEWGRCEYEIQVCPWPYRDYEDTMEKVDCYTQVKPNIRKLAQYVLETYYERDYKKMYNKSIARKPKNIEVFDEHPGFKTIYGTCKCGAELNNQYKYCPDCGQKLDWSID